MPLPKSISRIEIQTCRRGQIRKLEHLAGNVGYLRLDGFMDPRWAGETAIAAMNFLGGSDALIVDLRYNHGGKPTMIQLLLSYFFDEPRHINSFYIRKANTLKQFWTYARVEGCPMSDANLFVLTSGETFSAGEEFTYDLQAMKRQLIPIQRDQNFSRLMSRLKPLNSAAQLGQTPSPVSPASLLQ